MSLKRILILSLVANAVLLTGLYHKTKDTRAYYMQRLGAKPPSTAPEPPTHRLGAPPVQPLELAQEMVNAARPVHAYQGEAGPAFEGWRKRGAQAFAERLGFAPPPFSGQVIVTARTEFPTVTREKLYLKSHDGVWIPGYLLVPKGLTGRRPAVLAMPGHDGPTAASGRGAASIAGGDTSVNYMRAFGLRLAEAGYVVLAIDVAGVGELADLNYLRLVREGVLVGKPLKRLMLEEVHEAMDYLLTRAEVDPQRVGTAGVSLGGELALFAGVLDPRVRFVASSGFFSSYRDYAFTNAASLFIPGVLQVGDIPDFAAMIAPRPMLLQVGQYDSLIKANKLGPYIDKTRLAYLSAGAPGAVTLDVFPDSHIMEVPRLLDWFKRAVPLAP